MKDSNKELIKLSEELFRESEKMNKFNSKFALNPIDSLKKLNQGFKTLKKKIPDIEKATNSEELIISELKRRTKAQIKNIEFTLNPSYLEFDFIISYLNIPRDDIDYLRDWLKTHKKETIKSIERLYETRDVKDYHLVIPVDIPSVKRQVEEVSKTHIDMYHEHLGKLIQKLTKTGDFLREIKADPTEKDRSYFSPLINTFAISIPNICYLDENRILRINERELIRIYGHEGRGHALNQIITKSSDLPFFLKADNLVTKGTMESVAMFYQNQIFEDLNSDSETQEKLDIRHKFDSIYKESKDLYNIDEYNKRLTYYAISVLADKSLGDPKNPSTNKRKAELLYEVSIGQDPIGFIEKYNNSFDSKGNLNPSMIGELIYCTQTVKRGFEELDKKGIDYSKHRSEVDLAFLTGFWTPKGFNDNIRILFE